jgi:hypothetical protein
MTYQNDPNLTNSNDPNLARRWRIAYDHDSGRYCCCGGYRCDDLFSQSDHQ